MTATILSTCFVYVVAAWQWPRVEGREYMRVACGLKLRTYLYLLSGGLEAEHDTNPTWPNLTLVKLKLFATNLNAIFGITRKGKLPPSRTVPKSEHLVLSSVISVG